MIKKILIANRGEIALRIQRSCKKMGIATVAIYNHADANAAFVKEADEATLLPGDSLNQTYLNIDAIINVAIQTGAHAIHPGYGFLSENASFVDACNKAGIIFIGPSADAMRAMGNKIAARTTAVNAGVPVTPGITGTAETLLSSYKEIGFPILIKAAAGGGGKGMRVVENENGFEAALEATSREAKNYFGDSTVYIEKYIATPRHIEVQILGDQKGNVLHLFERECSLQRRHQKIIEEAPSATLSHDVRQRICEAAVSLAQSIGYYSAGTMEFLLDEDLNFYFLEMNTRIQVEHPVTELTTDVDIVEQQIQIANGEALTFTQTDLVQKGAAIECRIYAEDPLQQFLPSPGTLTYYQEPLPSNPSFPSIQNTMVRIDGMQLQNGDTISGDFDPMIAKVIVWADNRETARLAMLKALQQYHIKGIQTNIAFLYYLLQHNHFINNQISTKYIDKNLNTMIDEMEHQKKQADRLIPLAAALAKGIKPNYVGTDIWQSIGYWRLSQMMDILVDDETLMIELVDTHPLQFKHDKKLINAELKSENGISYHLLLNGESYPVSIYEQLPGRFEIAVHGITHIVIRRDISNVDSETFFADTSVAGGAGRITSPMPGKVIKISVTPGDKVKKGDTLLVVEAMKMENNIISPADAVVDEIPVKEGDKVDTTMMLIHLSEI